MYTFNSQVRYSEVNSERQLTIPAMLDYFQDCCTFQSEELGIGVDYLEQQHTAWVLSSWEIIIEQSPRFTEQIKVSTWAYDFKGFYGYRNFSMTDKDNQVYAFANSLWVYMDMETMRPARISDKIADTYMMNRDEKKDYPWSGRKIKIEETGVEKEPIVVQRFHIDTNHHMNNSKYVQLAEAYLPEESKVAKIRVEYKMAAMLGDTLYPKVFEGDGQVTVVFSNIEGKIFAIVQFQA